MAFIIDVFAGVIVGWRVSSSMEARFVLDALEQALDEENVICRWDECNPNETEKSSHQIACFGRILIRHEIVMINA